ncbi:hypothetical protein JQC92_16015 [Shewanella sp. 202IG2-18]|uniref:hypothetical protein n=1 Tax=Parashewanella hymeniacidonis TaxID=2807618 RepID=UPI0019615EF3|nr:hypothetical protein [Parashewanella hymeniacidonis]MBM7073520.1 hypothetical protein [Parashewanella hymeniacidonis]
MASSSVSPHSSTISPGTSGLSTPVTNKTSLISKSTVELKQNKFSVSETALDLAAKVLNYLDRKYQVTPTTVERYSKQNVEPYDDLKAQVIQDSISTFPSKESGKTKYGTFNNSVDIQQVNQEVRKTHSELRKIENSITKTASPKPPESYKPLTKKQIEQIEQAHTKAKQPKISVKDKTQLRAVATKGRLPWTVTKPNIADIPH